MRIDPALRALRSDEAPQREAQAQMAQAAQRWRESPGRRELGDAMRAFGAGEQLGQCGPLLDLFASDGPALLLVADFVAHFVSVLRDAPLGQIPSRYAQTGSVSTLLLARQGRAMLSLVSFDGAMLATRPPVQNVSFADGERHEAVLAGSARARIIRHGEADTTHSSLSVVPMPLAKGCRFSLDTGRENLLVDAVDGRLVTLRLLRTPERPRPTREYALSSGERVHQAAGDVTDSCRELMVALLGRMGCANAAPGMVDLACNSAEPDHLRWQAVREALALDTATGFAALCTVARDADDTLAAAAGALRAQLIELHPVLAGLDCTAKEPVCRV